MEAFPASLASLASLNEDRNRRFKGVPFNDVLKKTLQAALSDVDKLHNKPKHTQFHHAIEMLRVHELADHFNQNLHRRRVFPESDPSALYDAIVIVCASQVSCNLHVCVQWEDEHVVSKELCVQVMRAIFDMEQPFSAQTAQQVIRGLIATFAPSVQSPAHLFEVYYNAFNRLRSPAGDRPEDQVGFAVGDEIDVRRPDFEASPGRISRVNHDGTCDVDYAQGDRGTCVCNDLIERTDRLTLGTFARVVVDCLHSLNLSIAKRGEPQHELNNLTLLDEMEKRGM